MANRYCTATNWGKGFITNSESTSIHPTSQPGTIFQATEDGDPGNVNLWFSKIAGVEKTLSEAQALVDAAVTQSQTEWDEMTPEERTTIGWSRPTDITLEA